MNVRQIIEILDFECELMTITELEQDRRERLKSVRKGLDGIMDALGLPLGRPECCGCGCAPLQECPDCGCHYCEACGDVQDGEFVCDVCREEREDAAQENESNDNGAAVSLPCSEPSA